MQSEILPVTGIFLDRYSADSTARALRDEGLSVDIHPVAETNPAIFHLSSAETNIQLLKAVVAEPLFLLIGVSLGVLLGLLLQNALAGIVTALLFAFGGALLGLWIADRPPARYREYAKEGGVMLTVHCTAQQQPSVIDALEHAHALEVDAAVSHA